MCLQNYQQNYLLVTQCLQLNREIRRMSLMGKQETMLYLSSFKSNYRLEFTDEIILFYNINK